jgi:hypothetical protein
MHSINGRRFSEYLSSNVSVTIVDSIVPHVILRQIDDAVSVLALKLLFTGTWLGITKDCVAPKDHIR